eukprot:m.170115 g.170115  ORF g.170115 m.170115 type:complete len:276 (+) comp14786_c0_seq1:435-1262(+)
MPPTIGSASACVDPWDDSFFLGGRRPPANRGGSGRRAVASAPANQKLRRPASAAPQNRQPVVVGNVTMSGSRSGEYGRTYKTRPSTAPAGYRRDFAKLNKAALRSGLVTAKEQMKYREINQGYVKTQTATGRRPRDQAPTLSKDHVYGMPSPKPESIDNVITLQAGREWFQTRHAQMLEHRDRQEERAKHYKVGQPLTTRSVMLRRKDPARIMIEAPTHKQSKFDIAARPTVSTFRSEGARDRALRKQDREAATHEGTYFMMGIKRNPAGASRNL